MANSRPNTWKGPARPAFRVIAWLFGFFLFAGTIVFIRAAITTNDSAMWFRSMLAVTGTIGILGVAVSGQWARFRGQTGA